MNDEILDIGIRNLSPGDEAKYRRLLAENIESKKRERNARVTLGVVIGILFFVWNYLDENYLSVFPEEFSRHIKIAFIIVIAFYIGCLIFSFFNAKVALLVAAIGYIPSLIYFYQSDVIFTGLIVLILHTIILAFIISGVVGSFRIESNKRVMATLGI